MCFSGKMTSKIRGYNKVPTRANAPVKRLNMDYGFVCGSTTVEGETSKLTTSKDDYKCYFLIVDEISRYLWVFFFATKSLPIDTVTMFLTHHGTEFGMGPIRTDQGAVATLAPRETQVQVLTPSEFYKRRSLF